MNHSNLKTLFEGNMIGNAGVWPMLTLDASDKLPESVVIVI